MFVEIDSFNSVKQRLHIELEMLMSVLNFVVLVIKSIILSSKMNFFDTAVKTEIFFFNFLCFEFF